MGSYEPGERLIEATLSTELGTSRGPVREALRQLENEGLVMSFPYRGAVVLGVSDEEVQEVLIPIRLTLERYSFMHALDRMTDEDFAELGKQVWLMEQAARRGRPRAARRGRPPLPRDRASRPPARPHTVQIWRTIWPRIRAYFFRYGRGQNLEAHGRRAPRPARRAADARSRRDAGPAREAHRRAGADEPRRPAKGARGQGRAAAAAAAKAYAVTELLTVKNLRTGLPHRTAALIRAVDGVDFSIPKGGTLGVVGESGSGKSVTALSIMRLSTRRAGSSPARASSSTASDLAKLDEDEMAKIRGNEISMIFQEPMTSLNPVFTVGEQIAESVRLHQDVERQGGRGARPRDDAARRASPRPRSGCATTRTRCRAACASA